TLGRTPRPGPHCDWMKSGAVLAPYKGSLRRARDYVDHRPPQSGPRLHPGGPTSHNRSGRIIGKHAQQLEHRLARGRGRFPVKIVHFARKAEQFDQAAAQLSATDPLPTSRRATAHAERLHGEAILVRTLPLMLLSSNTLTMTQPCRCARD